MDLLRTSLVGTDRRVINEMPGYSRLEWTEMNHPPTFEELFQALRHLKRGTAGGKTGILPELLRCGGTVMQDHLLLLMQDIWIQGSVVSDRKDAVELPIPKKGYIRLCGNRQAISLLDVAQKILAQIRWEQFQLIGRETLSESQCNIRKGRGCIDMVLALR